MYAFLCNRMTTETPNKTTLNEHLMGVPPTTLKITGDFAKQNYSFCRDET